MWAETLLNEEAAEPFLLLSNCMLLCLCLREGERASHRNKVLLLDFIGALSRLKISSLYTSCLQLVSIAVEGALERTHNGAKSLWQLGCCTAERGMG